jgi:Xaa-Pro aminopeptidase
MTPLASHPLGVEALLQGFEPDFDFTPVPRISAAEYASRIERMRREATVAGHDALLVHADGAARYAVSNNYLRYACNWEREGILIIPTDTDRGLQLLSFFTQAAIMPPAGEVVGVEALWQVGAVGREFSGRPGDSSRRAASACAKLLADLGYRDGSFGVVGDASSAHYWDLIGAALPHARLRSENGIFDRLQRRRSPEELAQIRAAAQLIDIGYQAACHVTRPGVTDHQIYAAFTYAQLARGGETGDGYQIGVNRWGTHCGKPYGHVVAPGDLINLYISNVMYHGYACQSARMIAVGEITDTQEETLAMCTEAVRRAEALIRPGVPFGDLHRAAFSAYLEHGYLSDDTTATMPYSWAPADDGGPRRIPEQYVPDVDYEAQGGRLNHVYPALAGPHNPNLGHETGTYKGGTFNVTSHNTDRMEPGMVFVLHAQWLDPLVSGANIGDAYAVTETGYERLTCHSPLETFRVPA